MNRRKLWIGVLLGVVVVGGYAYFRRAARPEEPRFDTTRIEHGRIAARITATGTLSALVTVQVGSQVSGRIQSLNVDFNSQVKKGELIARIDPQLFEAAMEQARANYVASLAAVAKAEAQAEDAKRQQVRARALAEKSLIAVADRDTADANAQAASAQLDANKAAVEQNRAALHQAQVNLAYTYISSPINGVVISRNVDVGQTVASALQAPTLFTIAEDLRKMQVHTNVAEADVGRLSDQMVATFRVDAYPTDTFKGVISQIRNSPQTVQNVVTYDAVIDVDNSDLRLRPGMTANVTVVYAERDDALKVPNAALRFRPPPEMMQALAVGGEGRGAPGKGRTPGKGRAGAAGRGEAGQAGAGEAGAGRAGAGRGAGAGPAPGSDDHKVLWVLRKGQPEPVSVRLGVSDGTVSEILEGELQDGDQAITDLVGGAAGGQASRGSGGGPNGGPNAGLRRIF